MKTDTHPVYNMTTFKCACGAVFVAGSTIEGGEFKTEICSKCHPFYTGKQKLVDSSGRVDKFMAKMKKAQAISEKNVKKVDSEEAEEAAKETTEEIKKEEVTETKEESTEEAAEEKAEAPTKKDDEVKEAA